MPRSRIPSPARSQGGITPRRHKPRGSRSVCSPALSTASGRLTSVIDQFKEQNLESFALSPVNRRSVLTDNTDIEEPRRKSWWKNLNENSRDVMELLKEDKATDVNNAIEDIFDIEVLSQEKKNYTLDLPESSDNESINSIVLPQRRLFTQKENQPRKKFGQLVGARETLAKLHKSNNLTQGDKTIVAGTKNLFQGTKRSKPIFPAALLNISPNKTVADKTKENVVAEPKVPVRNIFGNRPANKRKNMFADVSFHFIASESEDEISEIQPKVFGFQKKVDQQHISSIPKGRLSPTSSINTDIDLDDDWKHLPSSTMVENQLDEMVAGHTPVKRARLSKLSEVKEAIADIAAHRSSKSRTSPIAKDRTQANDKTVDKTKQADKSVKNKSWTSPRNKDTTKAEERNNSNKSVIATVSEKDQIVTTEEDDDELNFTLEYDNDDEIEEQRQDNNVQSKSQTNKLSNKTQNATIKDKSKTDNKNTINKSPNTTGVQKSDRSLRSNTLNQSQNDDANKSRNRSRANKIVQNDNVELDKQVANTSETNRSLNNANRSVNKSNKSVNKSNKSINKSKKSMNKTNKSLNESLNKSKPNNTLQQKTPATKTVEEIQDSEHSAQENIDSVLENAEPETSKADANENDEEQEMEVEDQESLENKSESIAEVDESNKTEQDEANESQQDEDEAEDEQVNENEDMKTNKIVINKSKDKTNEHLEEKVNKTHNAQDKIVEAETDKSKIIDEDSTQLMMKPKDDKENINKTHKEHDKTNQSIKGNAKFNSSHKVNDGNINKGREIGHENQEVENENEIGQNREKEDNQTINKVQEVKENVDVDQSRKVRDGDVDSQIKKRQENIEVIEGQKEQYDEEVKKDQQIQDNDEANVSEEAHLDNEVNENEVVKDDDEVNISQGEQDEEVHNNDQLNGSQAVQDEEVQSDDEVNESQEVQNEEVQSGDEANDSVEVQDEEVQSDDEVNESQEVQNEEVQSDDEANESQEVQDEEVQSEDELNESQEIQEDDENDEVEDDDEVNESQETEDDQAVNTSQEVEEDDEDNKSHEVEDNEEDNESQDEDDEANQSQEVEKSNAEEDENSETEETAQSTNANQEHETDDEANASEESENEEEEANQSQEIEDQEMEDSADTDKAIATDEMSENDQEEMEVDDENDESNEIHADNGQAEEIIEDSTDVTHDTTGRNRKKIKSPEVILLDKTNQHNSFTVKGRNTSIREIKSMYKDLNIKPSLAPARDSIGLSDGTRDSSAEGSGWDSHRTTRKTLRQTFGKDFTPRKSLRALVMEKSAKQSQHMETLNNLTAKFPQANSTEYPDETNRGDVSEDVSVESDHELSRRMRLTTLEAYLQKMQQQNIEKRMKMEEAIRNSIQAPPMRDSLSIKVPPRPPPRKLKPAGSKPRKQIKSGLFGELPTEVLEDMKYKPPKRFQPANASWITKRLYKFLEGKLEPKYDYKARVRAEKLVETIYQFVKELRRTPAAGAAPPAALAALKLELARLGVVTTHFEFYEFFHEYMPREVRIKVVPDIVNKIPMPRHGIFSDILRGNTIQG